VADQIGGCTSAMLTGLARDRHVIFPLGMRLLAWLERPAADFVVLRTLRHPEWAAEPASTADITGTDRRLTRGTTERSDGSLRHRRLPGRVLYLRDFWASQIPKVHLLLFQIVVNVGDLGRRLDASDDDFRLFLVARRHP
jgi:hypothetical protein